MESPIKITSLKRTHTKNMTNTFQPLRRGSRTAFPQRTKWTVPKCPLFRGSTLLSFLQFYSSGIFDSSQCSTSINHAMLVIGYGTSDNNKEYWILKNRHVTDAAMLQCCYACGALFPCSWGTDWGVDGYILMTRNQYNQCGIASDCSYPSL